MREVASRLTTVRLVIVGDGPLRQALESQVRDAGLQANVEFAGAQPNSAVKALMRDTKVFALACRYVDDGDSDALPVVIREAMGAGVPVVSTQVAGIPETVDRTCGWLSPPEDPQLLAEALLEALTDPAELCRRGLAARSRVQDRYSLQACAAGMLSTFEPRVRRP